jgi:SEC-C motif
MDTDATDPLEAPAWAAELLHHLGQAEPLAVVALTERLRTHHPDVTVEQVELELCARCDVHETAGGWVSLLALADGAVLSHLLSAEERQAGVLAADGDLDLWARLADEGLPLAGGGLVRTRWALSPQELPRSSSSALAGPDGWLGAFEDDTILTLRLRGGALELGTLADQRADETEEVAKRLETVVEGCAGAALDALRVFADAAGSDHAGGGERADDEPGLPGAPIDDMLAELLLAQPGLLDSPLPPLSLLLTAAGLEVTHGVVMLAGAPGDPDEVEDLSAEEIRWFTLARGFLWTHDADRVSAEELDRFLTVLTFSPLVLERVADEMERNPADEALLEAVRRAAATPIQRAAAALLAARSAEGDGRPVEAEELVLEALGHDPDLEPALCDAADYAATRGDAASADAHLRRAGAAPDDGLRRALRPLLVSPPRTTPRNSPCPCGSGRKYKLCCLRTPSHPLSARAQARYASIATYATRAASIDVAREYVELAEPEAAMFALDLAIFQGGILDDYLDERGDLLPDDERALVERWRSVPLAPYEVSAVQSGASVTMRPLLGGDLVCLADRSLSGSTQRLDLLVARVLDDGDGPALLAHPLRVDRLRRRALLELFDGGYEPWEVAVFFGPQPPPALHNREGHLLVQCTATYDIPEAEGEAAWSRLAAELEEDDGPDQLLATGELDDGEHVIRGSVRRVEGRLEVEANSVERLGELQQQVLAAAPGAKLVSESIVPMQELLAEGWRDPQTGAGRDAEAGRSAFPALGFAPDEEAALLEQVMREYEQRWLDHKLPALDGRTPRQAAAEGGSALAKLHALLDDIQWQSNTSGSGMSAARIRRHLGLTDD